LIAGVHLFILNMSRVKL